MKSVERPWPGFKISVFLVSYLLIISSGWADSGQPPYKQLSCSPETDKSPGALIKANFSVAKDEQGTRVVADVQSLMLVANGQRFNADSHFFNSFWGEEKDGVIVFEPNDDGSEQSAISKLEISINEHTEAQRSRVILKNNKTYAMNCKIQ